MFPIVFNLELSAERLPTLYSISKQLYLLIFQSKYNFAYTTGQKTQLANTQIQLSHRYKSKMLCRPSPACLLYDRDSTAFKQCGFPCLPPNLINRWVMPIKQLSAGRQSSLASFKQLQCPSCSRASLCQCGGENATCMNQGAVSQCGPCLFYWRTTGPNSRSV